jgi:uncharacterized MAPEG superfamily protein
MTTAQLCLLVACLLPVSCAWIAKAGAFGLKDNHDPRAWLARQQGWRARANAAQANGFEALPLFIAGLFVAHQQQAPHATVDMLALAFVAARVAYIGLYLADWAALRSVAWVAAVAAALGLFFAG